MRRGLAALSVLAVLAGGAGAEGPVTSGSPMPRPVTAAAPPVLADPAPAPAGATVWAPRPRPARSAAPPASAPATDGPGLAPRARPDDLALASAPAGKKPGFTLFPKASKKKPVKGSVCGDPDIRGEELKPIKGTSRGCGLAEPVRVTSISGVALNPGATIGCDTAAALKDWIETGMGPAFGRREVVELKIAASYICRTQNNRRGAKISEHGRGNAIDISAFVMADGTVWTVEEDYNRQIARAHAEACGIFGTTLGPGSDGYHEDHLHFDIADHGNGPYCR